VRGLVGAGRRREAVSSCVAPAAAARPAKRGNRPQGGCLRRQCAHVPRGLFCAPRPPRRARPHPRCAPASPPPVTCSVGRHARHRARALRARRDAGVVPPGVARAGGGADQRVLARRGAQPLPPGRRLARRQRAGAARRRRGRRRRGQGRRRRRRLAVVARGRPLLADARLGGPPDAVVDARLRGRARGRRAPRVCQQRQRRGRGRRARRGRRAGAVRRRDERRGRRRRRAGGARGQGGVGCARPMRVGTGQMRGRGKAREARQRAGGGR
jgi:hypothetical protein